MQTVTPGNFGTNVRENLLTNVRERTFTNLTSVCERSFEIKRPVVHKFSRMRAKQSCKFNNELSEFCLSRYSHCVLDSYSMTARLEIISVEDPLLNAYIRTERHSLNENNGKRFKTLLKVVF